MTNTGLLDSLETVTLERSNVIPGPFLGRGEASREGIPRFKAVRGKLLIRLNMMIELILC